MRDIANSAAMIVIGLSGCTVQHIESAHYGIFVNDTRPSYNREQS